MRTYKLHLIRHGLTQGNLDGIYMGGGLDMPLCEEGQQKLEDMKNRYAYPNVGVVFSSPMKRALQSAEILYPYVQEKLIVEELRENNFGEFEGRKIGDLMNEENFTRWLDPASNFVPAGGESGKEFASRTARALLMMMNHLARNNITEAACIAHGGVIMSMLSQNAMPRKNYNEWMCDNGAGFTVMADASMIMRDGIVEVVDIVPKGYI